MTPLYFGEKKDREKRKEKKKSTRAQSLPCCVHSPHHQKNHFGLLMTSL